MFPPSSVLSDGLPLPRLIVFDLDYTLWPFWVDTHVAAPVKTVPVGSVQPHRLRRRYGEATDGAPVSHGDAVVDRFGEMYSFYDDVPDILQALPAAGIHVGVASRTSAPDLARDILRLLLVPAPLAGGAAGGTDANANGSSKPKDTKTKDRTRRAIDAFDAGLEIYPSNKIRHMEALHARTGIAYEDVLFFDDESRNRNVESLGITMHLVRDGVGWGQVERGVREWRKRHGHPETAEER